uniref:Cytochrome P450 n=1 Tax=Oryza brachyantha TaxID=4533 RepID=J3ME95_ORYBR
MEPISTVVTLLFLSLLSLAILAPLLSRRKPTPFRAKTRRPPGPWRLPFVGSLHHLARDGGAPLRDLARRHGPVMYLRLGEVDTVVVSSPAAAEEVLRGGNDVRFASRPSLVATEIICYGNLDVAFAPYGAYWRALRKLCTVELLSARKVRELAPGRDAETRRLVGELRRHAGSGRPVNLGRMLVSCANAITGKAAFGERCGAELQGQFLAAIEVALRNSSGFCVGDLFPSLRFVDAAPGMRRRLWRARHQLDAVLEKIIADCERRRNDATRDDNLLSILLRIRDEGDHLEYPINTVNIKAIVVDMFTAGTETTSAAAEWVMTELMRHPSMLAKAQAEVRQELDGTSPHDHETHMGALVYTRMVIKESLRLHPPLPLLLPRVCRETCYVGGFEVPVGTRVTVNAWAMARSPEYWADAEEFRPERFERSVTDYKGTHLEYLPFGSGRRMCPGVGFGLAALELMVARLLYYFDWSLPARMRLEEIDMDVTIGATARRSNQLHLVASPYISFVFNQEHGEVN